MLVLAHHGCQRAKHQIRWPPYLGRSPHPMFWMPSFRPCQAAGRRRFYDGDGVEHGGVTAKEALAKGSRRVFEESRVFEEKRVTFVDAVSAEL